MRKPSAKRRKAILSLAIAIVAAMAGAAAIPGCAEVRLATAHRVGDALAGKVHCVVDEADASRFAYGDVDLQILDQQVDAGECGEWVGYLRKLVALDGEAHVVSQHDWGVLDPSEAAEELAAEGAGTDGPLTTVSMGDVFRAADEEQGYVVEVDGALHRAVAAADAAHTDTALDLRALVTRDAERRHRAFGVDSRDSTLVTWGEARYRVGDDVVPDEEAGMFVGVIAQSVVFDAVTRESIADPAAIDVFGNEEASRQREHRTYGSVFEPAGEDAQQALLVEVDSELHRAERV